MAISCYKLWHIQLFHSNDFDKLVKRAPNTLFFIYLSAKEDNIEISKEYYQSDKLSAISFSKIFQIIGRNLIGLWLSF